ncbi:MAG: PEP-CTERM sorting domain-containing protein, partial [Gemmatimonadetes bacterium]|nr:PEP-CTERM sorting domain-containing protein [Gemmatimonadota bacterium]
WSLFSGSMPASDNNPTNAILMRDNAMTFASTNPNNFGSWRVLIDDRAYNTAYSGSLNRAFITTSTSVVPEPSTYALMATGLVALGVAARRRRGAMAGGAATA